MMPISQIWAAFYPPEAIMWTGSVVSPSLLVAPLLWSCQELLEMLLLSFAVDAKRSDKVVVSGVERKATEKYRSESCRDTAPSYKTLLFIHSTSLWPEGNSGIAIDLELLLFSNLGCLWLLLTMARIGKRKGSRSCRWFSQPGDFGDWRTQHLIWAETVCSTSWSHTLRPDASYSCWA